MRAVATMSMLVIAALAAPAFAQEDPAGMEVVVTAARRDADGYDEHVPAIGLRRLADYAVQPVTITGDTRDPDRRHEEIFEMIRAAIELAAKRGDIEIATGALVVEPLTLANYRSLTLKSDKRPDSDKAGFLIKARLASGMDAKAALDRITAFIKAVPSVGRAELETEDDLTLSVVRPDQYRDRIVELIATDARAIAARFGPDYAVEVQRAERPVEWSRASLTDVFLYVPYTLTIVPRAR